MASDGRRFVACAVPMLAVLGLCIPSPSTMNPQGELLNEPQDTAVPAELREHLEDRFRSPRMRSTVAEAFALVSASSPAQRRDATLFLLDLGDEDVTGWLLFAANQREVTLAVLAERGATPREIVPIAKSMADLAWPAGVIQPVSGDADDPTGVIQRLGELFSHAVGVAGGVPSISSDGYYHKPGVSGWCREVLDRAMADPARPASIRSWLRYCREALGE